MDRSTFYDYWGEDEDPDTCPANTYILVDDSEDEDDLDLPEDLDHRIPRLKATKICYFFNSND